MQGTCSTHVRTREACRRGLDPGEGAMMQEIGSSQMKECESFYMVALLTWRQPHVSMHTKGIKNGPLCNSHTAILSEN